MKTKNEFIITGNMLRHAFKVKTAEEANQVVTELAQKSERDEGYIRWYLMQRAEMLEHADFKRLNQLYYPEKYQDKKAKDETTEDKGQSKSADKKKS